MFLIYQRSGRPASVFFRFAFEFRPQKSLIVVVVVVVAVVVAVAVARSLASDCGSLSSGSQTSIVSRSSCQVSIVEKFVFFFVLGCFIFVLFLPFVPRICLSLFFCRFVSSVGYVGGAIATAVATTTDRKKPVPSI